MSALSSFYGQADHDLLVCANTVQMLALQASCSNVRRVSRASRFPRLPFALVTDLQCRALSLQCPLSTRPTCFRAGLAAASFATAEGPLVPTGPSRILAVISHCAFRHLGAIFAYLSGLSRRRCPDIQRAPTRAPSLTQIGRDGVFRRLRAGIVNSVSLAHGSVRSMSVSCRSTVCAAVHRILHIFDGPLRLR